MASKRQAELKRHWRNKGYFVINMVNVFPKGLPDLLCLKPKEVIFVESKEDSDKLSPLQKYTIKMLVKLGFDVYVNYDKQVS